jgi:hypothetical protein
MESDELRSRLSHAIAGAAEAVEGNEVPTEAAAHQLIALVRSWGYRGLDWKMPEQFQAFDLLMTDLVCGPPSPPVSNRDIREGAREVRKVSGSLA